MSEQTDSDSAENSAEEWVKFFGNAVIFLILAYCVFSMGSCSGEMSAQKETRLQLLREQPRPTAEQATVIASIEKQYGVTLGIADACREPTEKDMYTRRAGHSCTLAVAHAVLLVRQACEITPQDEQGFLALNAKAAYKVRSTLLDIVRLEPSVRGSLEGDSWMLLDDQARSSLLASLRLVTDASTGMCAGDKSNIKTLEGIYTNLRQWG